MEEYTPGQVWSILSGEPATIDEGIDVVVGLSYLPEPERTFLRLLSQGETATRAMGRAGMKGKNVTRAKREALARLTKLINGEKDGNENSPNQ